LLRLEGVLFDVTFYSSIVRGLVLCLGRRLAITNAAMDRKAGYAHHGGLLSGVVGGGVGDGLRVGFCGRWGVSGLATGICGTVAGVGW
jgi:hypothetical protein